MVLEIQALVDKYFTKIEKRENTYLVEPNLIPHFI